MPPCLLAVHEACMALHAALQHCLLLIYSREALPGSGKLPLSRMDAASPFRWTFQHRVDGDFLSEALCRWLWC